jgi:hypothetical protein
LPGDPATDLTVLPDSPDAEQMGDWIDMVHFNQRMEERRQKVEAERQGTAFEILASAAGMLVEPLDYLLTAREIYHDPTNLYSYAGLVPGIPAGAGKILKHADEAAEIAGAAAKGRKAPRKVPRAERPPQKHHWISMAVHRELSNHPTLAGVYRYRDDRFVAEAIDYEAHVGLQRWHIDLDTEVVNWLKSPANSTATPLQFESWLQWRYGQPDLKARFPQGKME